MRPSEEVKKGTPGCFERVVEGIEHIFHREPKLPHSRAARPSSSEPSNRMYELGHSAGKGGIDSDDSDAELLGPDGQLPYQ